MTTKNDLQQYYARERAAITTLKHKLNRAISVLEQLEKYPDEYLCVADAKLGEISPHLPIMLSRCKELLNLLELRTR